MMECVVSRTSAFFFLVGSVALGAATGCESRSDDGWVQGLESAEFTLVQKQTFNQAFQLIEGIDYLPFQYREDGCYARALYMSMELAADRIASNSLFAFANGDHYLEVGDLAWSYHVAPLLGVILSTGAAVKSSTPVEWRVIDPALSDTYVTALKWLNLMGRTKPEYETNAWGEKEDLSPTLVLVPGSRYAPTGMEQETTYYNLDVPDLESMPAFAVEDVKDACTVMYDYLGMENQQGSTSSSEMSRKRARLLERTTALTNALVGMSKLDTSASSSSLDRLGESFQELCQHAVDAALPAPATAPSPGF